MRKREQTPLMRRAAKSGGSTECSRRLRRPSQNKGRTGEAQEPTGRADALLAHALRAGLFGQPSGIQATLREPTLQAELFGRQGPDGRAGKAGGGDPHRVTQ